MIAIDASVLLLFLSPTASVPLDPVTSKPVTDARARVDFLIERSQKTRTKIVIPTPVLSEVLVRAGSARNDYLRIIQQSSHFRVMPFDARAAVDVADMTRIALDAGDKKGGSNNTWAKVKFDRQIVAIAKNEQVTAIYSDDPDIKNIATQFDIPVIGLIDMPISPDTLQASLDFEKAAPSAPLEDQDGSNVGQPPSESGMPPQDDRSGNKEHVRDVVDNDDTVAQLEALGAETFVEQESEVADENNG